MAIISNDYGGLMRLGLLQCELCGVYAKDVAKQEGEENPRCSGCLRRQAEAIRSATPEELAAQRESYGRNYKPGPRQATPFMPQPDIRRCPDGCIFGDGPECYNCANTDRQFAQPVESPSAAVPVEDRTPMHHLLSSVSKGAPVAADRWAEQRCSCGLAFEAEGEGALARSRAMFEAHKTCPAPPIPEERTAEMEKLTHRLRLEWEDEKWAAIAVPELMKLLDHIEGKAKAESIQEVKE